MHAFTLTKSLYLSSFKFITNKYAKIWAEGWSEKFFGENEAIEAKNNISGTFENYRMWLIAKFSVLVYYLGADLKILFFAD